jgi:hypothetical protein
MAKNSDGPALDNRTGGQGHPDRGSASGTVGSADQGSLDPGSARSEHHQSPRIVQEVARPAGGVDNVALALLLPGAESELSRSPGIDFRFVQLYPNLWVTLYSPKTRRGDPRANGELAIKCDGAVWVITLTMPEEELTLQAESPELSDIFSALEGRLTTRPIPWRKAGRYVKKKQLSPKKSTLPKSS